MRRSLHGVEVEVAGALPAALLGELLGGFPEGDRTRAPDLVIALEPAAGPPDEEGRSVFFHGAVQARESGGAITLSDGHSTARVAPGGARIELLVAPASLDDRHAFEHVLALIALVVALRHRGLFHLHAGALARADGRAVLVAGGAGAGKSTLTLALLEHGGLAYLGDDAAFLAQGAADDAAAAEVGEGVQVRVCAFPRPFHLGDATARAFPRLAPLLSDARTSGGPNGGKRSLDPQRAFPGRARMEAAAPAAILLPRIDSAGPTRAVELAPAAALGALLESSALLAVEGMPGVRQQLELLSAAAGAGRSFEVLLGPDLLSDPERAVNTVITGISVPPG